MFQPEFDAFAALYDAGEPTLVSLRLVADLETPGFGLHEAVARPRRRRLPA